MKILTSDQCRELDAYTIEHEPISSVNLMERAASECFNWIVDRFDVSYAFEIFVGTGNNGGDGLVIARLLLDKGFSVTINIVRLSDKLSVDFDVNYQRLSQKYTDCIVELDSSLPIFKQNTSRKLVVVDAILGSGLTKPIIGFGADVIKNLNEISGIKIAIDIPSGLNSGFNDDNKGAVFCANYTLTFQLPKLAFLFASNYKYVGEFVVLSIGLNSDFIHLTDSNYEYVDSDYARLLIRPRHKFDHKGIFGRCLIAAGSYGKMGAAVLAAKAALRTGVGLVILHVPKCGYEIVQTAVPETMCIADEEQKMLRTAISYDSYSALAIGPGIGTDKFTANVLKVMIQNAQTPMVFDADAINILSSNKTWLSFIPKNSIFTPHLGEYARLIGAFSSDEHRVQKTQEFCNKYSAFMVLKGAYSMIVTPTGFCYFNSSGNPGMATAGCGDVLTGIIVSLLAQGYDSESSCVLGVFLHGMAGDIAADQVGLESLIASDIIANIGYAYKELLKIR